MDISDSSVLNRGDHVNYRIAFQGIGSRVPHKIYLLAQGKHVIQFSFAGEGRILSMNRFLQLGPNATSFDLENPFRGMNF